MTGAERLETRLGVLFRAPLWELLGEHRYGIYFVAGERAFIPAGRPDRWAFARAWDDSLGDPAALPTTRIEGWIRAAAGDPELPIEIEDASRVSFGVGLAERFRDGDAFLIGDAAHRVTPRGGTGLNTAIGDGFDLGWKLAWVVRGWAGDELLDTYERERRPVAEFNLERSSQRDGSILAGATGLNLDLGGRIAHAWAPREDRLVSTIDLLGDGLTLLAGPDWDGPPPAALPGSPPIAIERLDTISARTLGLAPGGALLARPDGQPLVLSNRAAAEVAVAA